MTDPNRFEAEFGELRPTGRIAALEGNRGQMRLQFDPDGAPVEVGQEGVLQMHDGARFRVMVTEALSGEPAEYRVRLTGKG